MSAALGLYPTTIFVAVMSFTQQVTVEVVGVDLSSIVNCICLKSGV
ncbi:TPA: hypothetical protein HHG09_004084 [Escherichia coli]|nr:hypothetical protein [Escherichia coli]